MPTKSAPTPPTLAQTCSALQAPASTAGRGATAATESRNATTTVSALARTNSPLRLASMPAGGMVENTRPPAAGSVAIAWQGIADVERQRRAGHQRRGDVGDQPVGAGALRPQDGRRSSA